MKCPMIMLGYEWQKDVPKHRLLDCIGEECAWYNTVRCECLAQSLYEELRLLVGAAGLIADGVLPGSRSHE